MNINDLLSNPVFEDEDKEAIEQVNMLLVEYGFSDDQMSERAFELKKAMTEIWNYWESIRPKKE